MSLYPWDRLADLTMTPLTVLNAHQTAISCALVQLSGLYIQIHKKNKLLDGIKIKDFTLLCLKEELHFIMIHKVIK
jgi:hypothetical protein